MSLETASLKLLFSSLAILLTFIAFIPYIRSIVTGETKAHVFSWVIWGTTTSIVFFAQWEANAGMGAWPIGVSGAITCYIAFLAFQKRGDTRITRTDWYFFLAALLALPVWYLTASPVWAVVVLTLVDLLGFGPTLRKAYDFPHEENRVFFVLFLARNGFALLALETYSIATALFPAAVGAACIVLLITVCWRRHKLTA